MESIHKSEIESQLLAICEGAIASKGFRVVDLDFQPAGRSTLRLFIERSEGDQKEGGGVSLGDCSSVSQLLSPLLDVETILSGPFDLEVSSPGLDRRLRLRPDFERCIGSEVKLRLLEKSEGTGMNVRGKLIRLDQASLIMQVGNEERAIPLTNVRRANVVWEFQKQAK